MVFLLWAQYLTHFKFETISEMNGDKGIILNRFLAQVTMLFSHLGGEEDFALLLVKNKEMIMTYVKTFNNFCLKHYVF